MGRRLRFFPDRPLVELTARTLQGRFLLKPSPGFREIFIGILARAAALYAVDVHAFVCAGNHLHLLCTPADAHQLARFMAYLLTNLSKEAGRLHRWRGPLLQRRYQAIVVSNEEDAQVGRLRYLVSHGVKESLVARVLEWPGAHCAHALLTGEAPIGVWFDRTAEHAAKRRGEDVAEGEFASTHQLELATLPCWRHLPPEAVRRKVAAIVADIEADAASRHQQLGTSPLGVAGVLRQDPHDRPKRSDWSPAPLVHAASTLARDQLRGAYLCFLAAFRIAAQKLKAGCRDVVFPPGCFPPSLPFCRGA